MGLKEITIFLGLCVPFLLGTVWAVVDAAQKDFGSMGQKVIWLIIAAIPFVGFILYFVLGFRRGKISKED
jgi:hypothetical protein